MIERSVGSAGSNAPNDTLIIQCALNVARARSRLTPIAIDGLVGPETTGAILAFQRSDPNLTKDGRIDPSGRTLTKLTSFIGGEEHVFGPIVQQLLAIKSDFDSFQGQAPQRLRATLFRVTSGLGQLTKFRDLAEGAAPSRSPAAFAFNKGAPSFGFVGVDDVAAAAVLAMMALIMALLLVLIIQSPAFRKAVAVRAKELDRIMHDLQINASVGLKESVDIISSIFADTKEEEQRCRKSPTFSETPECTLAIREFAEAVRQMQTLLPRLVSLLFRILDAAKRPHASAGFDVFKMRIDFNSLLAEAQALAFELQVALAVMREKCKCPDL